MARRSAELDKAALEAAALAYLERYASSAENLRRVLLRKIRRAGPLENAVALAADADAIVERYVSARLVDDRAFARGRAATLARRGDSRMAIQHKLRAKGVADADTRAALDELSEDAAGELDLLSAWRYARRRRLGPYRADEEARALHRDKDLAALCRRGFSFSIAERVVKARIEDAPA